MVSTMVLGNDIVICAVFLGILYKSYYDPVKYCIESSCNKDVFKGEGDHLSSPFFICCIEERKVWALLMPLFKLLIVISG